jgi:hypothetical protein
MVRALLLLVGMNRDRTYQPNESSVEYEILAYLTSHPEAKDTLEGIARWWILEQRLLLQIQKVQEAIKALVEKELLVEEKRMGSEPVYCFNRARSEEIHRLVHAAGEERGAF